MTRVSIREFARQVGVDEKMIRKMRDSEKIVQGFEEDEKGKTWINYEVAIVEYNNAAGGFHSLNYVKKEKPEKKATGRPRKEIVAKVATKKKEEPKKAVRPELEEDGDFDFTEPIQRPSQKYGSAVKNDDAILNAKRASLLIDARMKEISYKERIGALVDKEKVYKALFVFGQEAQKDFMGMPARILDDIRALPDRGEAEQMFSAEIHRCLMKLLNFDGVVD